MNIFMHCSYKTNPLGSPERVAYFIPPTLTDARFPDPLFASSQALPRGGGMPWSSLTPTGAKFILRKLNELDWEVPKQVPPLLFHHAYVRKVEREDRSRGYWLVVDVPDAFLDELEQIAREAPAQMRAGLSKFALSQLLVIFVVLLVVSYFTGWLHWPPF